MTPPAQLPRVRSAEASIEKGREAYAGQRFRVAIEHFTLVANNCPCSDAAYSGSSSAKEAGRTSPHGHGRNGDGKGAKGKGSGGGEHPSEHCQRRRRQRCTCRDFDQAVARYRRERGSIYAEATKECRCGVEKTWGRCYREGHVQALDYRAACFEKMGKLDMARRDAEWLLEIAPRRLEGYLRLGKIHRLEKKPELAWAAWSAGVEVGQREGLIETLKYQQLCKIREPLHRHYARKDPMDLPTELIEQIFSYLGFRELCRISGVCKRWEQFFDTHPYLWRDVQFQNLNPKKPPRVGCLMSLRKRAAGHARSLAVSDMHAFQMNKRKWQFLIHSTNPQTTSRLELGGIRKNTEGDWGFELPPEPRFFEGLAHLKLSFYRMKYPDYTSRHGAHLFAQRFLERAWANLHTISLTELELSEIDWPELPCLKVLQLSGPQDQGPLETATRDRRLDSFQLARATPNLEQIFLDNFAVCPTSDSNNSDDIWGFWKCLQVVRLGIAHDALQAEPRRYFPPLHPSSFRVFEARIFSFQWRDSDMFPFQLPHEYGTNTKDVVTYPNLERLWMPYLPLQEELANDLLEPAVRSGRLREVGFCWHDGLLPVSTSVLDVLRGAASVRMLGIFEFILYGGRALTAGGTSRHITDPAELWAFVESFPNLEVLELDSTLCEPLRIGAFIERLVGLPGTKLKTVYQRELTGVAMDQLREICEARGVELVYGSRNPGFPVPLEPLEPVETVPGQGIMGDEAVSALP